MGNRRLGKSAIVVSDICMGTMTFGSQADEAVAHRVLDMSLDAGINFFDTANIYSYGASESILGKALNDYANRDEIVVATKVHQQMRQAPNAASRPAVSRMPPPTRAIGTRPNRSTKDPVIRDGRNIAPMWMLITRPMAETP